MQIDYTILERLEKLSYLKVDEGKKDEIISQLSKIVNYIENLNELDTDHLDASFSILKGGTPMREDMPRSNSNIAKNIMSHSSDTRDDFFIVPAILN